MLVAELWGRDGVSASDLELQHTLGLTRSRLTELLRTLAAHGVLASYPGAARDTRAATDDLILIDPRAVSA